MSCTEGTEVLRRWSVLSRRRGGTAGFLSWAQQLFSYDSVELTGPVAQLSKRLEGARVERSGTERFV